MSRREQWGNSVAPFFIIDLDEKADLVIMTIEHAREKANIAEIAYQQMDKKAA